MADSGHLLSRQWELLANLNASLVSGANTQSRRTCCVGKRRRQKTWPSCGPSDVAWLMRLRFFLAKALARKHVRSSECSGTVRERARVV